MLKKIKTYLSELFRIKDVRNILLFGIVVRLIMVFLFKSPTYLPDSHEFTFLTTRILKLNLIDYIGVRSPGYPMLMALGLRQYPVIVLYQFCIGIITSIIWYKTLLNLNFKSKHAFYITLFLSSFLHIYLYELSILAETLLLFMLSFIFYLISDNYLTDTSKKKNILMSLLIGYLVLVKPFFAFVPFIIYGFIILKNFSLKKLIQPKISIVFAALFCYFGWSYLNKVNTGYFVSTTFYGLNKAQTCVYFAENTTEEYKELAHIYAKHRELAIDENKDVAMSIWYAKDELMKTLEFDNFPDFSNYLGDYADATISMNQNLYWNQVFFSWKEFWRDGEVLWSFLNLRNENNLEKLQTIWEVQKYILLGFKFFFVILVPYYVFRFFINKKITFELLAITVIFAASVLQAIVTFGTNSRYSFPFEYLMIIVVILFLRDLKNKKVK